MPYPDCLATLNQLIASMKVMCQCGRKVDYETPFDDFSTRRVPCGTSCRQVSAQSTTPQPFARPNDMLTIMPGASIAAHHASLVGN